MFRTENKDLSIINKMNVAPYQAAVIIIGLLHGYQLDMLALYSFPANNQKAEACYD